MATELITYEQLKRRISLPKLLALYDDENSGDETDATFEANIEQLIDDASSAVRGALGPIYDTDQLTTAAAATLEELRRIALDIAQAMSAQRHPEVMQYIDGFEMMKQAERQLANIRKGLSNLGAKTPPEPAANQGGDVVSGDPDAPDCLPDPIFLNGTGFY